MDNLGDIPRDGRALHGGKVALVFEDCRLTYKELDDRVNRLANALTGLGVKKGGRVTILADNTPKYMEVYFAAAKIGASVTPLNLRLSDREINYIINDSAATVCFAGGEYEQRSLRLKSELERIETWISLDGRVDGLMSYEDLLGEFSCEDPMVEVDENEMAILMYTGGTTGLPKGVMLSHRNILTASFGLIMSHSFTRKDTTCFCLPLFHTSLWPVLCLLMLGGRAVILRGPEILSILKSIHDHRCTHIVLVPTLLSRLIDDPKLDDFDLSSLRLVTYAGSPMPIEVLKRCVNKMGNIFVQGYGLTEAAPFATLLPVEDHFLEGPMTKLLSSVGKAGLPVEARVVDEKDRPLEAGKVGEIVLRGRNIMMGYWKNPELTASTLRNGWLHTGDIGRMDEDGYIYLVDRRADMIITGGENVYPKETEDALYSHPDVRECAVVSAPDAVWGERVQAVVVLKLGCSVTEEELIRHCKSRLAGYKCPKKVEFWDDLPKTAIGKIARKEVKKHFC